MEERVLYSFEDLHFSYQLGEQRVAALQGVTLAIQSRQLLCFSGPSGSGKTTLLNILGLVESPQRGRCFFRGQDLRGLDEKEKNRLRRYHIGYIFPDFHLLPVLTAEENVEYFLSRQGLSVAERKARVHEALKLVDLWQHRSKRPHEMDAGQRQRVAVARAMAKHADVIVADEPTARLSRVMGRQLMETFQRLRDEKDVTVVIASHDPEVHSTSDRLVALRDGLFVEDPHQEDL